MTWDLIAPIVISAVTSLGGGSLVKIAVERQLRRAQSDKTATEGEVAASADYRAWLREERDEARKRVDSAEKRLDLAETRAATAQNEVFALRNKVEELEDRIRELTSRLERCPGGNSCPMHPLVEGS